MPMSMWASTIQEVKNKHYASQHFWNDRQQ